MSAALHGRGPITWPRARPEPGPRRSEVGPGTQGWRVPPAPRSGLRSDHRWRHNRYVHATGEDATARAPFGWSRLHACMRQGHGV